MPSLSSIWAAVQPESIFSRSSLERTFAGRKNEMARMDADTFLSLAGATGCWWVFLRISECLIVAATASDPIELASMVKQMVS
jgi:hypothetical protein